MALPLTREIRTRKSIPLSTSVVIITTKLVITVITITPKLPSVSVPFECPRRSTHLLSGLDNSVLAKGFESNGQQNATAGQAASLTSSNNFINFCVGKTITNGQQVKTGSCNPMPMGDIPSNQNMPSCKFTSPNNLDTLKADTTFTIKMALINMQAGVFTNPDSNYFAAPQQLNQNGQIIGHSHFVIQPLKSITANDVLDPAKFTFFKGIDTAAQNGVLSLEVPGGIPPGTYKLSSINTAANHQAVAVPVAQHGSMDDAVYVSRFAAARMPNQLLITIAHFLLRNHHFLFWHFKLL